MRENYLVDEDRLLIVASDRISAFDVVHPHPHPRQGPRAHRAVGALVPLLDTPNHLLATDVDGIDGSRG